MINITYTSAECGVHAFGNYNSKEKHSLHEYMDNVSILVLVLAHSQMYRTIVTKYI